MNNTIIRRISMWTMLMVMVLLVVGCTGTVNNQENHSGTKNSTTEQSKASQNQTAKTQDSPKIEEHIMDTTTLKNDSGKTMIKLLTTSKETERHASYAIVSSKGTVIVADPNFVPSTKGLIKADIVTVSHMHSDHSDPQFLPPYLKQEIEGSRVTRYTAESFTVKDVKVTGIPASHGSGPVDTERPTNVIYLFEVDGLRIAHFGDMAQDEITEEQLQTLGELDVSISAISNAGRYGFGSHKTIKALGQLKPAIVMPGHYEPETVETVLDELKIEDRTESDVLFISREDIDSQSDWRYVLLK